MNEENTSNLFHLTELPLSTEILALQQSVQIKEQDHSCIDCEWFVSPGACNNFQTVGTQTTNYSPRNNDGNCSGWEAKNISAQRVRNELVNSRVRVQQSELLNQESRTYDLNRITSNHIFPAEVELSFMSGQRLISIVHEQKRVIVQRFNIIPRFVLLGQNTYYKMLEYAHQHYYFAVETPLEVLTSVVSLIPVPIRQLQYYLQVVIPNDILL